jgi:2-polyprenyl-6-methoxyphenol hydroxylase-like FAD-dependent oxidoreductase
MNRGTVRPAQKADVREFSRVQGRAFHDDPVMMWLFPDEAARRKRLPRLFDALTRHHHLAAGGVEVGLGDAAIVAAALWDPPGRWRYSQVEQLVAVPSLVRAFGLTMARGSAVNDMMERLHPEEPRGFIRTGRAGR